MGATWKKYDATYKREWISTSQKSPGKIHSICVAAGATAGQNLIQSS